MARFAEIARVVDAVQWGGKEDTNRILNWLASFETNLKGWAFHDTDIAIPSIRGKETCLPGHWIVRTNEGCFWSYKDEDFHKTYKITSSF